MTKRKPSTLSARSVATLRVMLEERRRQLTNGLNELVRDVRTRRDSGRAVAGQDWFDAEHDDADLDIALLQIRTETLAGINGALRRLEAGTYGRCGDCSLPIALERLRALPFAARCKACEEAREGTATQRRAAKTSTSQAFD